MDCYQQSYVAPEDREVWIYFVQGDDGGPVKIGSTSGDPIHRMRNIQGGYPFGFLRLVGLFVGKRRDEVDLHRRFHAHRMIGEWFKPHAEIVAYLATSGAGVPGGA